MPEDYYRRVSTRIESDWYPYHENEWFTQEDICKFFDWRGGEGEGQEIRKAVSRKLYHDYKEQVEPRLEKNGRTYRLIDKTIEELDWQGADAGQVYKLMFPYGVYDKTQFGFEDAIRIPPKGIVLIAGTSNEGKTAFCLNMVVLNMDTHKVTYFTNEYTAVGLKRRLLPFTDWHELTNGNGKPKFKSILRYDNYQDVIDPDGLNVIDYLDVNAEAEYFKLVPYIKRIQRNLKTGIAIIALQKPPNRPDAFGGFNLRGAASLYLSIDKGKLTVVKAKDWVAVNPNGKKYGFGIDRAGSIFTNIHEIYEEE